MGFRSPFLRFGSPLFGGLAAGRGPALGVFARPRLLFSPSAGLFFGLFPFGVFGPAGKLAAARALLGTLAGFDDCPSATLILAPLAVCRSGPDPRIGGRFRPPLLLFVGTAAHVIALALFCDGALPRIVFLAPLAFGGGAGFILLAPALLKRVLLAALLFGPCLLYTSDAADD